MVLGIDDYIRSDATELARLVNTGEVAATELLELAEAQLVRLNPALNAVNRPMLAEAQARVQQPLAGLLAGVPMLIKDAIQDYAGLPTSNGSRAYCRIVPGRHSTFVQRLLDAGAVIIGKSNTPELALKGVTDPKAFGVTRNPWDLSRTSGGSSGGSAAAVAAGIVPMAGANDGGGSIRIPAACCGLFGLRPSRGRVPPGPAVGEIWEGASSDHVLTRSVRDSALALDVLAGPERGDPFVIAPPAGTFVEMAAREPGRLRVAFSAASPLDTDVHPEAVKAVNHAAKLLSALGHDVVEERPKYDGLALARCYLEMYFGQVAATLADAREAGARSEDFELATLLLEALGKALSAGTYVRNHRRWNEFARALGEFHRRYDVFLTPTIAFPPVDHAATVMPAAQRSVLGFLLKTGLLGMMARLGLMQGALAELSRQNLTLTPFTQLANLTGTPAMSVPLYWTDNGLPLGVQFIAAFGNEALLLQLAYQLERAQPWMARLPAIAFPH
ncbi:amidase [Bradyrhizobium sp. Ce-3]|uniref:amidase n=1 Tax=Bradyrhizobium sp. Ce-3 TaxID=2913970 RepID=UPI001FC835F0|nr:amidase [Bradyrhizobium sp. Ce-3]GKQ53999.1 6-aminohexanoate-cyclic-dimer hydrolase [Bradyrhizobium sp. Ce-3]